MSYVYEDKTNHGMMNGEVNGQGRMQSIFNLNKQMPIKIINLILISISLICNKLSTKLNVVGEHVWFSNSNILMDKPMYI